MGFFDFMGTFFFISLGITFVLILLLAYHFKQRLSESEQKSDKMFEIINTIVKEMGNMKRAIAQCSASLNDTCAAVDYTMPYIKKEKEYDDDADNDDDDDVDDNNDDGNDDNHDNHGSSKLYSSLNMYDHGNAVFIELGNTNRGDVDGDVHDHEHEEDSEDKDDSVEIVEHEPEVKVVNVDLTYDSDDIATDGEDSSNYELDDIEDVKEESNHVPELHTSIGEELIHVNKLDEVMPPLADEPSSSSEEEKLSYHKMNLTQLRAYAVSKGLLSDSSKMKKADLIKLLESNDENE